MRPPPAPLRRLVRDPLWPPLAVITAAVFAVIAVAGGLTWPVTRRARVARLALLAALYLVLDAALLVACGVLWLASPVAARRDAQRWDRAHAALLRWALGLLRRAAGSLLGFRVRLEEPPGGDRPDTGPLLLLARHAGPGDSFTLVELLLSRYRRTPRIVLKDTLRWDPGLDVVLGRLGACFLPPHTGAGAEALTDRLASMARGLHGSDAMLIFPEGRNWTPGRYQRALARLRRRRAYRQAAADAAGNPHVLPPRPAGVLAILAARPSLGVVVIAHTGLDDLVRPAQVWAALPLAGRPMTVRWWYVPPGSVPRRREEQYQWLRVQWALVDSWIGARRARSGLPAMPAGRPAGDGPGPDDPPAASAPEPAPEPEPGPVPDTAG